MSTKNVLLNSSYCINQCLNNSTNFVNFLPEEINCEEYEVALSSLILNLNFSTPIDILKTDNHLLLYATYLDLLDDKPLIKITIRGSFMNPEKIVNFLNNSLKDFNTIISFKYEDKRIILTIGGCILLVKKNLLNWLKIKTDDFDLDERFGIFINTQETEIIKSEEITDFKRPKYLRVVLQEMEESIDANGYHQDLAVIASDFNNNKSLFYTQSNKEYFKLKSSTIQQFSIKIVDENYDELYIDNNNPTILHLKMKRNVKNVFSLRLSSNDSKQFYPENKINNFKIRLNKPLNCAGISSEVALSSVIFPNEIDHAQFLLDSSFIFSYDRGDGNFNQIPITKNDLETLQNFILIINFTCNDLFTVNSKNNSEVNFIFKEKCKIRMSKICAKLFNKLPNQKENTFEFEGEKNETYFFKDVSFQNIIPNVIFIYCNFVTPILTGNGYLNLLKIVPITLNKNNNFIRYNISNLDFFTLSLNDESLLEFQLYTYDNIPFPFKNDEILLTLLFREKINK